MSFTDTWLPLIAKTGLGVLGNVLQANAYNKPEQFRENIINSEIQRRNNIQGIAAPTLAGMLGYRTPQMGYQLQQAMGAKPMAGATGSYSGGGPQGSALAGGLGAGGVAAGLASTIGPKLGLSALGGPIGLGIGGALTAGSLLANKIGQGRRTANTFVQGTENPFGTDLATIAEMAKTNPQGAAAMLKEKYGNYMSSVNQGIAAGGNQAKVAQQSLNNQALKNTYTTLGRQLGVQL